MHILSADGLPLSNTTFPHVLPLITLLECDSAPAEGPEPWGSTEHGVEVVLAHLEAARIMAHHGGLYHTNAEAKLQGESQEHWARGWASISSSSGAAYTPLFLLALLPSCLPAPSPFLPLVPSPPPFSSLLSEPPSQKAVVFAASHR